MKVLRALLAIAAIGLIFVAGFGYGRWYSTRPAAAAGRKILYYVDAMHPWYKSDKPGIAPDCGMKLVPVYADGTQGAEPAQDRRVLYYRDPKKPGYKSDKPGLNPETGDDLEPVYAGARPANAIRVAAERQQLIGIRSGKVEWFPDVQVFHATGRVVADEELITRIQARTDGWITAVSADYTGKFVARGEPLFTFYSPELLSAQQEYLLASKARAIMQHSSMHEMAETNADLADAARRRLLLLDFTPAQIRQIEESRKPIESVTVYSPADGYVMSRNAFPGQRLTPETELYTIANLSQVWVMADVVEADAPQIRPGEAAHISIPGTADTYFARVMYIQPQIDPATRTLKVRLELPNPKMRLRPDMLADAEIEGAGQRRLSVPASAVLDAGTSKTVFLDRGDGYFEPREVETGVRFADRVEIVKGLRAGERIVTSGTFLLNSEAQIRQASSGNGMAGMSMPQPQAGANNDQSHH